MNCKNCQARVCWTVRRAKLHFRLPSKTWKEDTSFLWNTRIQNVLASLKDIQLVLLCPFSSLWDENKACILPCTGRAQIATGVETLKGRRQPPASLVLIINKITPTWEVCTAANEIFTGVQAMVSSHITGLTGHGQEGWTHRKRCFPPAPRNCLSVSVPSG